MFNITFQQLEVFLAAAEHLNLSETASAMYISQSAISKIISRMEVGIGVQLFKREHRGVSLTEEGRQLYNNIKKPFEIIVSSIASVQNIDTTEKAWLRIGCADAYFHSTEYDFIRGAISEFIEDHPVVDITETIYESESLRNALIFDEVDIIITQAYVASGMKDVNIIRLAPINICLGMSASYDVEKEDGTFDVAKLSAETVYMVRSRSTAAIEDYVRRICAAIGFTPKAVRILPNLNSLLWTLNAGRGISICGVLDILPPNISLKFIPIDEEFRGAGSYITAVWADRDPVPKKLEFINSLRKYKRINQNQP